jgi:hypothetical protein
MNRCGSIVARFGIAIASINTSGFILGVICPTSYHFLLHRRSETKTRKQKELVILVILLFY